MENSIYDIIKNSKGKSIWDCEYNRLAISNPISNTGVKGGHVKCKGFSMPIDVFAQKIESGKYKIVDNPFENWTVEKKDEIERILISLWATIGMDIPTNYENIVQDVYEDVCETADTQNWNNSDVVIGFRRWIEKQN